MSLRRTSLFDTHVALGARMVPFAGYEMPVQYSGIRPEHLGVRSAVGLFDVSHMGEVFVRGPSAFAAIQHWITNDASRLADGEALYTVACNEEGGCVDDLVIYRIDAETWLICVNAANREKDVAWFRAHNPHEATIDDESEGWCQLAVQGPHAAAVVASLTDAPAAAMRTYTGRFATVAGVDGCFLARTGYTGEDGYEIFGPSDAARTLWDAIREVGAEHGLLPVGLGARDTLRLEARMHLYGHELDETTSPWQAGLARVIAMDKPGGFVGREALQRRKGHETHRLVAIVLDGKRIARDGMTVLHEGREVGRVTSGTRSPTLGKGIALAYVEKHLRKPGTALTIDVRGREASGVVHKGAFYRRPRPSN